MTDRLGDLADGMKRDGFSHLPILGERDVIMGVFNEAAVFDYLWADIETIMDRKMRISDTLCHCSMEANHTETFRVVGPHTPFYKLVEVFRAVESPATRMGAVFVTASGKNSEPLQPEYFMKEVS